MALHRTAGKTSPYLRSPFSISIHTSTNNLHAYPPDARSQHRLRHPQKRNTPLKQNRYGLESRLQLNTASPIFIYPSIFLKWLSDCIITKHRNLACHTQETIFSAGTFIIDAFNKPLKSFSKSALVNRLTVGLVVFEAFEKRLEGWGVSLYDEGHYYPASMTATRDIDHLRVRSKQRRVLVLGCCQ